MSRLDVGDRYLRHDQHAFKGPNGERGSHDTVQLCEVTKVDPGGWEYIVVELVSETGRPAWSTMRFDTGGGQASFAALDWWIERGDITGIVRKG